MLTWHLGSVSTECGSIGNGWEGIVDLRWEMESYRVKLGLLGIAVQQGEASVVRQVLTDICATCTDDCRNKKQLGFWDSSEIR